MSHAIRLTFIRLHDEKAATAVEYALMIALIALVIFGAVQALGIKVDEWFRNPDLSNVLS